MAGLWQPRAEQRLLASPWFRRAVPKKMRSQKRVSDGWIADSCEQPQPVGDSAALTAVAAGVEPERCAEAAAALAVLPRGQCSRAAADAAALPHYFVPCSSDSVPVMVARSPRRVKPSQHARNALPGKDQQAHLPAGPAGAVGC